jgi:hypothetical protein
MERQQQQQQQQQHTDHTIIQKGSKTTLHGERETQGKTPIDLSSESINGVHRCPDDLPTI